MAKKAVLIGCLFISSLASAEQLKTLFNGITGAPDFYTALSTTSIAAGSGISVSTTSSGVTISASGSAASNLAINQNGVQISSPTGAINFIGPPFIATQVGGTTAQISLDASSVTLQGNNLSATYLTNSSATVTYAPISGSKNYIQNTSSLQLNATFYISSGTVAGLAYITPTISSSTALCINHLGAPSASNVCSETGTQSDGLYGLYSHLSGNGGLVGHGQDMMAVIGRAEGNLQTNGWNYGGEFIAAGDAQQNIGAFINGQESQTKNTTVYGVWGRADGNSTGTNYGVFSEALGNNVSSYGGFFKAQGGGASNDVGVYATAGSGTSQLTAIEADSGNVLLGRDPSFGLTNQTTELQVAGNPIYAYTLAASTQPSNLSQGFYVSSNGWTTISGSATVTGSGGLGVTYNVNVGSITGGGLATCGDATHGLGYNSSNQFTCQSITGTGGGGGSSTLAFSSGSATNSVIVSSPTSNIVADSNTISVSLQGTTTSFFKVIVGGSSNQIQYNSNNAFGATNQFSFNPTTGLLGVNNVGPSNGEVDIGGPGGNGTLKLGAPSDSLQPVINGNSTGVGVIQIPKGILSGTFANLPAQGNGVVYGCSDCTDGSNPCTGGGQGAIAVRENGAWTCNAGTTGFAQLAATQTFTGANTFTSPSGSSVTYAIYASSMVIVSPLASQTTGLTVINNDVNSLVDALVVQNAGQQNAVQIIQTGNVSKSFINGGAFNLINGPDVTNPSAHGALMVLYSSDTAAIDNLVNIRTEPTVIFSSNIVFISGVSSQPLLSVNFAGTTGEPTTGGAGNFTSSNPNFSAMSISGKEGAPDGFGTLKITHTAPDNISDANAALLSLQATGNVTNSTTSAQAIFFKSTATNGTSGKLLNLRNPNIERIVGTSGGTLILSPSTFSATSGMTASGWGVIIGTTPGQTATPFDNVTVAVSTNGEIYLPGSAGVGTSGQFAQSQGPGFPTKWATASSGSGGIVSPGTFTWVNNFGMQSSTLSLINSSQLVTLNVSTSATGVSQLSVSTSIAQAPSDFLLTISSTDGTVGFAVQNNSHIISSGTTPSMGACGTSPSVVGTDSAGTITVGSGIVTSCTLNFFSAWGNVPVCVMSDNSVAITGDVSAIGQTSVTFSFSASLGSGQIYYICIGQKG